MKLSPLFHSHAVFQARAPIVVRGSAASAAVVEVVFDGERAYSVAAADGKWSVTLGPREPGGPHTLRASANGVTHVSEDLWIGEVWLGSGQSNMEWTLGQFQGQEEEIAAANFPMIRHFTVAQCRALTPADDVDGRWEVCSPATVSGFSATGYHFARSLHQHRGGAVGVITSAWGGTEIASWLPPEVLRADPAYAELAARIPEVISNAAPVVFHRDQGPTDEAGTWHTPELDEANWGAVPVGVVWQSHGWNFNGAVWFRLHATIPAAWAGRALRLQLGRADDFDDTYFNGHRVGGMDVRFLNAWATPRVYSVPAGLVQAGEAVIAVRVFDHFGGGGLTGPLEAMRLFPEDSPETFIPLTDGWRARVELALPIHLDPPYPGPGQLFPGMIAPLAGTALRGVIWYQGESDCRRASLYARLLTEMIGVWRRTFRQKLPFGIVQLTGYAPQTPDMGLGRWSDLREAQRKAASAIQGTGLVVTIDAGERDDIHPRHKRPVGERLARWARAAVYGEAITPGSPVFISAAPTDAGLRLHFEHARGLRTRDGAPVHGLEAAHASGAFQPVEARIEGETLVLPLVKTAARVRYAWADFPDANLENDEGLPVGPFTTG